MKKAFLLLAAVMLIGTTAGFAQKYGHVNANEIMAQMPGIDSVRTQLEAYQTEIQSTYETMVSEYQTKKDKFDHEVGTMSNLTRQMKEKELADMENRIMEFQQGVQDEVQEKQLSLLQPFEEKIKQAINDVAKENGYTMIFDTQILLYSEGGDDVSALVKKKLGIK